MRTLKNNIKITHFVLVISVLNLLLFHLPFFEFVVNNVDCKSFNGILLVVSLLVLMLLLNALVFFIFFYISRYLGKFLLVTFFIINSIAIYFVTTYSVILDESMIGNVLNTKFEESSSFFSFKLIVYLILFGILPSIYILYVQIINVTFKRFISIFSITLLLILGLVAINASNVLWIDKNSKILGGLAMPWSYTVNITLLKVHESQKNRKEILLPNAVIKDEEKSVVVLVIGESARSANFSLYGYTKNTNPLLSRQLNLFHFNATSGATYTTAGVKCILEHENSNDLYEILPNYLYRNNVEVIWRTTNWGEPPIHIKKYQNRDSLQANYKGNYSKYDEILLSNLKDEIRNAKKNKILVVLHSSTSHGPTYSTKYPKSFEKFQPVCNSVELGKCTKAELMNAYDNTIVYTDFILSKLIDDLKELKEYKSSMIFVSDHGESLGENNLYMHGLPLSIAPKEQYEIPFIVWLSDSSAKKVKNKKTINQNYVFHSVLNFLNIQSPIYNEEFNIFKSK